MSQPVVLVTGTSSGIGESTAIKLAAQGAIVYGAARHVDKMQKLADLGIHVLHLDVTDDDSARSTIDQILEEQGRIDILINNAGYGSYGAVEDVPIEEARHQLDVNVLGVARLTKLVLPSMRYQRSGKIINIASMGGKMWTPFGAYYHATKYALEGFSDALRLEVEPFGIKVVVIEPGAIESNWSNIALDNLRKTSGNGPYAEAVAQQIKKLGSLYSHNPLLTKSVTLGRKIGRVALSAKPRTRYLTGLGAKPAVFLAKVLPNRVFDKLSRRFM